MQTNLVIVESPAKAKTIERFLGSDYKVMPSFGHIRDLRKKHFGVDLTTFEPEYEVADDKAHVVRELKAQASKAKAVWLASDEDREGEAIAWHLAEVLGLDEKQAQRIVFHEITKPAILEAIAHPRPIDLHLVDAQQARRVLDRLVGFKLSPVLWRKVRPNLSAGRVQSVAVRLIVEREREIEAFRAEASWRVSAVFALPGGRGEVRAELSKRFATQAEAEAFLEACRGADFAVESIATKPTRRTPAPPFTTSTLQQEAARKLGFPVALTMRVAQGLYEAGLITYMRTDSMNLSTLCLNACGPLISERMGADYHQRRTYHTHTKGAQEAHEAIRPTDMSRETIEGSVQERRLYQLIWRRTVACQMADAQIERTTATISIGGRKETFVATGEVYKFDGFLRVYRESSEQKADADAESRELPAMSQGEPLARISITAQEKFTQQPPRYTEASLVHKLEELGIGRPSTYAPTISTIQQREYVAKGDRPGTKRTAGQVTLEGDTVKASTREETVGADTGKLLPTDIGIVVNDFLLENFPDIMDYNFTANVEKDFDAIAEGEKDWTALIRQFYGQFEPEVERTLAEKTDHKVGERLLGTDPASGRNVVVKIGRYGPMVQIGTPEDTDKPLFATLLPGQSLSTITLDEALELFKLPRTLGTFEEQPVQVGRGRFGPYVLHAKKYVSLPKGEDPMSVSLERAVELIEQKRQSDKQKHLKQFAEEPGLEILRGPYGPYIAFDGKNYKIPKAQAERAAELTLEECRQIMADEAKKPARSPRRKR